MSERHLRRALERELGVSPAGAGADPPAAPRQAAARRDLASGHPGRVRQWISEPAPVQRRVPRALPAESERPPPLRTLRARPACTPAGDFVTLTLAYRPPLDWGLLIGLLAREAMPGVILVDGERYGRTVSLDGRSGVVLARNVPAKSHLDVAVSLSLLPVLMPLLARLRHLFDLDAEPAMVDAHLGQHGLGPMVRRQPGLRIPGAIDGFEVALQVAAPGPTSAEGGPRSLPRVVDASGRGDRDRLPRCPGSRPRPERVAEAGPSGSWRSACLGPARRRSPPWRGRSPEERSGSSRAATPRPTHRALLEMEGVGERLATMIVMRALYWPDAFPASDPALQRAAGASSRRALRARRSDGGPGGLTRHSISGCTPRSAADVPPACYAPPSLRTSATATSPTI